MQEVFSLQFPITKQFPVNYIDLGDRYIVLGVRYICLGVQNSFLVIQITLGHVPISMLQTAPTPRWGQLVEFESKQSGEAGLSR